MVENFHDTFVQSVLRVQSLKNRIQPTKMYTPFNPPCQYQSVVFQYEFLHKDMGTILSSSKRDDLSLTKQSSYNTSFNYDLPLPPENGIETYYIEYQTQDKGIPTNGTGMIVFRRKTEAPYSCGFIQPWGSMIVVPDSHWNHWCCISRYFCILRLHCGGTRLYWDAWMDRSINRSTCIYFS